MSETEKTPSVFISYRTDTGRDAAESLKQALSDQGIDVLMVSRRLECPHPHGTIEEWEWLSNVLHVGTRFIPHVVVIASEGAECSKWVGWEVLAAFGTARCVYVYWVSGPNPSNWIAPLHPFHYWLFPISTMFLIDCRQHVTVEPVTRIAITQLRTALLSIPYIVFHFVLTGVVFYLSYIVLSMVIGAETRWSLVFPATWSAIYLVAFWPKRAVLAYRAQRKNLTSVELLFGGGSGVRIVLLEALIVAGLVCTIWVLGCLVFSVDPLGLTREGFAWLGILFLFVYKTAHKWYMDRVAKPLSQLNGKRVMEAAVQTQREIDSA
jgi:hypothetical protein